MSERVLKILLSELKTVRLVCQAQACGGIVELPILKLKSPIMCPLCNEEFALNEGPGDPRPLEQLRTVFRLLGMMKDRVQLEFLLAETERTTT